MDEVPSKGLEWTNLILGGCLACAAIFFKSDAAVWNAGIIGVLVMCFSVTALSRYGDWAEWSNLSLACWTLAAPFLLGFATDQSPMWTHVVLGGCIATVAVIQLVSSRKRRTPLSSGSR